MKVYFRHEKQERVQAMLAGECSILEIDAVINRVYNEEIIFDGFRINEFGDMEEIDSGAVVAEYLTYEIICSAPKDVYLELVFGDSP